MKKDYIYASEEKIEIKDGPPWSVIARFPSFQEAAHKVDKEMTAETDYDYKIKRYKDNFGVKKRLKPELIEKKKNNKRNKKK